jgi:hypothetical protein
VRAAARAPALLLLLWLLNLGLAALLAIPLAIQLEASLLQRGASSDVLYGFDYDWWERWHADQDGYAAELQPRILGRARPLWNLELLLGGVLPLGLFRGESSPGVAPLILGLGAGYALLQALLHGGILATLRRGGGFDARGLLRATRFYSGRMLRLLLLSLLVLALGFTAVRGSALALEARAAASLSERDAGWWLLVARLPALALLLGTALISSWSRVILVAEERRSALLAWLQALGLCLRHPVPTVLLSSMALGIGMALVLAWALLEERIGVTGFRTQLVALLLGQVAIVARIGLRVAHAGGQLELYRRIAGGDLPAAGARAFDGLQEPAR